VTFLVFGSCKKADKTEDFEKWKSEIRSVEAAFNELAQEKGLAFAFEKYAAPTGVIRKGDKVIQEPKAIGDWYRDDSRPSETLTWKPNFIDVSSSGDLAYTYGGYVFTTIDSTGKKKEKHRYFSYRLEKAARRQLEVCLGLS